MPHESDSPPHPEFPATEPATDDGPISRPSLQGYELGPLIGRGGMGEVVAARDEDIGRPIAIKRMRGKPSSIATSERFLREAKIQARLEHPSIVPVHEIGHDDLGQPYFTMKRISGTTLAELLASPVRPPRQRLLRAFVDVCSAVAFAHEHGVVHRDLKPANIMLGDYNEVYVLDWGLARVLTDNLPEPALDDIDSLDGMTQVGTLLGTPGYMAPEQVRGEEVQTPADVYALGSILFEILAGDPLHPRGIAALASTLDPHDGSPARKSPEGGIPPELDSLCAIALRRDAEARPTATELAARVESYLDGDRDHERRRDLASNWLGAARTALASDEVGGRAEAMALAGRALALDPESRDAAEFVTRLMLEPPRRLPHALQQELASTETAVQKRQSRIAMASFAAIVIFLVMASWNGLRVGVVLAAVAVLTSTLAAAAFYFSRHAARPAHMMLIAIGNATLAALLSRAFGSLIVTPAVTCVMAVSLTSYPQLIDRARIVIAVLAASWLVPVALEVCGVLAPTWWIESGRVISGSALITIGEGSTPTLLIFANLITIVVIALFANALARSRRDAQRQVEIQAWHLRQLLPQVRE